MRYQAALHSDSLKRDVYRQARLASQPRAGPRSGDMPIWYSQPVGRYLLKAKPSDIAAREASGYGPPRFVAPDVAGLAPACAQASLSAKTAWIGAWPSGKATGFGPVILGSNPSAPATLRTCYRTILCLSGTGWIRGRIPRCLRVLGFVSKWQRQFRAKFRRAPLRKSLGRHLGVNFPFW